jgi:hydroxyacylglutathione hydrolase
MLYLKSFTFNPFQENTYVIYTDSKNAVIIDPGNSTQSENSELKDFITAKELKLTRLLLTHAHLDHVMGNRFIYDNFRLSPEVHRDDQFFIDRMKE